MANKVWVFTGKTEDCENHVMVFNRRPTNKFLKEAFEKLHNGLYEYEDLFESHLAEYEPIQNPGLKKIKDGPY